MSHIQLWWVPATLFCIIVGTFVFVAIPNVVSYVAHKTIAMGYVLQEAKHDRADVVSHFGRHHGEVPKCATT